MSTKVISKVLLAFLLIFSFSSVNAQHHKHHNEKKHPPNYRYSNLPHWGHSYKVVPHGYYVYPYRGVRYHYYNGVYYKPVGNKYVIVNPPVGIRVKTLPAGNVRFVVRGRTYFYYYGTFYVRSVNTNEYVAIAPPIGARVDALPDDYRKVIIDNMTYYEFDGTYYKAIVDNYGEVWYEVVGEM